MKKNKEVIYVTVKKKCEWNVTVNYGMHFVEQLQLVKKSTFSEKTLSGNQQ